MASPRPTKRQRLTLELESQPEEAEILQEITCSICAEVFRDPVMIRSTGMTYCRACVTTALGVRARCPLSGTNVSIPRRGGVDAILLPNRTMRNVIDRQRVSCAYAPNCSERPKLNEVEVHEATCPCATASCSGSGCAVTAMRGELAVHERSCPFVLLRPILDRLEERCRASDATVKRLKERCRASDATVQQLQTRIATLESAAQSPRDTVHTDLKFDRSFDDDGLEFVSDTRVRGEHSFSARGDHIWRSGRNKCAIRVIQAEGYVCLGVVARDRSQWFLNVQRRRLFCRRQGIFANTRCIRNLDPSPAWLVNFSSGDIITVVVDCDLGTLSFGPASGQPLVTMTDESLKSEALSLHVSQIPSRPLRDSEGRRRNYYEQPWQVSEFELVDPAPFA